VYRVTPEGDKDFSAMLRESWWTVTPPLDPLMPAVAFMPWMSRQELCAALRARVSQIESLLESSRYHAAHIGGDPTQGGTPEHVVELNRLFDARMAAEVEWARALISRLEAGAYEVLQPNPGDAPGPEAS
jgi:hypothetical protein